MVTGMTSQTIRRVQEQSGSYYVALPKAWVDGKGLKQSDRVLIKFNDIVQIESAKKADK